jgi:adenylate cyclase
VAKAAGRRGGPLARMATGPNRPRRSFTPSPVRRRSLSAPRPLPPDKEATVADEQAISLIEAARRAGVTASTLKRWAGQGVIPIRDGEWTESAAAQARVVARMRERGHSLESLREAVQEGRLAFGYVEELLPEAERRLSLDDVARRTGLEPELIERLMALLGTPTALEGTLTDPDAEAAEQIGRVLAAGLPLVAVLQLVRVYARALRNIAEAEVRLFHLFVHEPLIREGVGALEISEEMRDLAADVLPLTSPLMEYIHRRYLRFYIEQDVVGHMETALGDAWREPGRVTMALCFIDLAGYTRYTEEEGDEEALDLVERFVETVESTLPTEATIVKTIGDEVMIVSPEPATLTEWAVGFLGLFQDRPQPRAGLHYGDTVYRDGDYFGGEVNLTHRVVARALGGEVMVTRPVVDSIAESDYLDYRPIGEVGLKGFPEPAELFVVSTRQ